MPKRSRHYQSMIDSKLLKPGKIDYADMNNVYIIVITPYDVFHAGKYMYTFRMACKEEPGLELQDGAVRIFLNTHGTNKEEVSPELVELLDYMENTNTCPPAKSEKLMEIQKRVAAIKSNEEVGVKYMQAWEEKVLEREAGRKEGMEKGLEVGRQEGMEAGRQWGLAEKLKEMAAKKKHKRKDSGAGSRGAGGRRRSDPADLSGIRERTAVESSVKNPVHKKRKMKSAF